MKTTELWAEDEFYVNLSGGGTYRLVAEGAFNVTNNAGLRYGTKVETTTATADYGPVVQVATSKGLVYQTC